MGTGSLGDWYAVNPAKCPECADCSRKTTYDCLQVARLNEGDMFWPNLANKPGTNHIKELQSVHKSMGCEDPEGYEYSETQSKFLGVHINRNISWQVHIGKLINKISQTVGIIRQARRFMDGPQLMSLYTIEYNGPAPSSLLFD